VTVCVVSFTDYSPGTHYPPTDVCGVYATIELAKEDLKDDKHFDWHKFEVIEVQGIEEKSPLAT